LGIKSCSTISEINVNFYTLSLIAETGDEPDISRERGPKVLLGSVAIEEGE
jgi:hypothetical protein